MLNLTIQLPCLFILELLSSLLHLQGRTIPHSKPKEESCVASVPPNNVHHEHGADVARRAALTVCLADFGVCSIPVDPGSSPLTLRRA